MMTRTKASTKSKYNIKVGFTCIFFYLLLTFLLYYNINKTKEVKNAFKTTDEAIAYIKAHLKIFTGIKIYLYNKNIDTYKKIKKRY